jgi:hypothetical protein
MNRGCRGNELHQALDNSLVIAVNLLRENRWEELVDFGLIRMESLYKMYIGPIKPRGSRVPDAIFVYRPYIPELESDNDRKMWPLFCDHFYFLIEIGECDAGKWPDHNWLHIGFDGHCTFRPATKAEDVKSCGIMGGGQDDFLEHAIGEFALRAMECVKLNAPVSRKSRPAIFKECSKAWSSLADAKSLRRINHYGSASFYLSDGLWMHACGQSNESDFCNCSLCKRVYGALEAEGVFNE